MASFKQATLCNPTTSKRYARRSSARQGARNGSAAGDESCSAARRVVGLAVVVSNDYPLVPPGA